MANYTQARRLMEVATPLAPDTLLLTGFTGREGVSQLFEFRLDLLAENDQEVPFDKLLGQPAAVRLALGGEKDRFFQGLVRGVSQGRRDQTFTHYQVQLVPQLWLLTKRSQSRLFQHLTVPDILKQVLAGLNVTYQIQGTFHPRDYCVQYRETDFAFASRLMEEEGIFYFFKHTADGHTMIVADTPESHPDLPEQARVIYEEVAGGSRKEFRITAWEKAQELRSGKFTLWDHCFELPHNHLDAQVAMTAAVQVGRVSHNLQVGNNGPLEVYDYPGGYAQRFDGIDKGGGEKPADLRKIFDDNQRTARIRMQQEALAGLVVQGTSNCRQFVSGHKFTLERHFNGNGPYVLTGVEHSANLAANYRSGDKAELVYENRFTCIPLALPFRPPRVTPRPKVEGTQTAQVVGPSGELVFCDKYGRVKVQFHWDREGNSDADSSCWLRVTSPWAGKRRGLIYVPMIGDEVVVAFLEGDPDQPIIIGSVYNAEMMPPYELPANSQASGYKGRTGSNQLQINDTAGKEWIYINAENDMNVSVRGAKYYTRVHGGQYELNVEDKVEVFSNTEIMLKVGASSLLMKADGTIELKGVKVTTEGSEVTMKGSEVAMKGSATVTSEAVGVNTVKGSVVKLNC